MSCFTHSTNFFKPSDVKRSWHLVDAQGLVLGRLAVVIAKLLAGKDKPMFTPNFNLGDSVVVINAEKVYLSGNKLENKLKYRHSGYPGGLKSAPIGEVLASKNANTVIKDAVKRMLKKSPLGYDQLSNLYVYAGSSHPHSAQSPVPLDVAVQNKKNAFRPS